MALIVEDGTGLTNSNSYASVEDADSYFADRSEAAWASLEAAAKEAALIKATDYIDASYVFRSVKLDDDQALENPRYCQTELHPLLVKATIELALIASTTNLKTTSDDDRAVVSESKTLEGVGSTSKTYADMRSDPYPFITKVLKSIAAARGGSASSMRLTQ